MEAGGNGRRNGPMDDGGVGQRPVPGLRNEPGRAAGKRKGWLAVLVVALIVLAASLAALGAIGLSYLQGQQKYDRIAEIAAVDLSEGDVSGMTVDWAALEAVNPDTVAWLCVPGTAIDYPVVRGSDNDFYLSHDFDGDQGWLAEYGAIFMDWRNDPYWADEAYFFYGHHMRDGSMFADVAALADQERFDQSRIVYVLSPNGNFKLRTFSLVHCAADDPLVQTDFPSHQEMADYIRDKIERSVVSVGDIPQAGDMSKLFALATCDSYSSGRYVLYAYVEEEVESDIVEVSGNAPAVALGN